MKHFCSIMAGFLAFSLIFCLFGCAQTQTNAAAAQSTDTLPDRDMDTLSVGAVIIARDSVNEQQVYDFVSNLFEQQAALAARHPIGALLDLDYAASVTEVPYHPGAARFFEEQGRQVSVKEGAGTGGVANLTMGTGNNGGNYFSFGSVLADLTNEKCNFTVKAVTSAGSKSNLEDMEAGAVQLCFVQADMMSYAYTGTRLFAAPYQGFSVVAAVYQECMQILTNDPALQTVDQLAGKRVCIGLNGSGVYYNALDVLAAYGLAEDSIQPVYQAFGDCADSLREGSIDAAFIVAGLPTPAVAGLVGESDIGLVAMDQEHLNGLLASNPFYSIGTIPAGTY